MQTKPATGERVKLHGVFLKNTGQISGGEGAKVWTVLACTCSLCADGRCVAVDEYPIEEERRIAAEQAKRHPRQAREILARTEELLRRMYSPEELRAPRSVVRHLNFANLMPEHGPRAIRAEYFP